MVCQTGVPEPRLFEHVFPEGLALMRERWAIYAALALACAGSAATVFRHANLLRTFASGDGAAALRTAPLNIILLSALFAVCFVLPSALRRIEPHFKMTFWRGVVMLVTLFCVGFATDAGYAAAFVPGLVVGVLLSQALIAALLRTSEHVTPREALVAVGSALRGSYRLTRQHFATTLGVCALSLCMLGVPFTLGLIALLVFDVLQPASLLVTAPLLFITFVYFESVRYVLIVRWYRRLAFVQSSAGNPLTA